MTSASFVVAHSTAGPKGKFDPVEWEQFERLLTERPIRSWRRVHTTYSFLRGLSTYPGYEDKLWHSEYSLAAAITKTRDAVRSVRSAVKSARRAVAVLLEPL